MVRELGNLFKPIPHHKGLHDYSKTEVLGFSLGMTDYGPENEAIQRRSAWIPATPLFVFQSDHGHSMETRGFNGGGSAGIYRGAKFSLFEGGIRVPAIISWKGKLKENTVINQMAFEVDWLPTVVELCGVEHRIDSLDGKSLVKMLKDPSTPSAHEHYTWQLADRWAVRKDDWKLLGRPQDPSDKGELDPVKDKLFLVNLESDPSEMINLAEKHPAKVTELKKIYGDWEYAKKQ